MNPGTGAAFVLLVSLAAATLQGQEAGCPGEPAQQVVSITYPLTAPVDSLRLRVDSVLQALGYEPADPTGAWDYLSEPRHGWPLGSEKAPWREGDVPPGAIVALRFIGERRGEVVVAVQVRALCAERSRRSSTDRHGIEYTTSLATAMHIAFAFEAGVEKVLRAYDSED